MSKSFHVAIGPVPNIMRRTSREVSGDTVLGFAVQTIPFDGYRTRINCDLLHAGPINDEIVHACLNTMCRSWGTYNIARAIRLWLQEIDALERRAPYWPR